MVKGGSEFCLEDKQRTCVVTEIQAMGAVRSQESRGGYSVNISLGRVLRTGVLPALLCSLVAAGTEQTV